MDIQKEETPSMDINLNSFTRFTGAEISSGFSGIVINATVMKIPYPTKEMSFLLFSNFLDNL